VTAGQLKLEAGDAGTTKGSFKAAGVGAAVDFEAGTFALQSGASLSGAINLTGGTLNATANVPYSGSTLTQSGGALGGAGTLTVSGAFNWSGGEQADKGTTVIASGGSALLSSTQSLGAGRTLQINSGATATMDATDELFMGEKARVENAGSFNANGEEPSAPGIYTNGTTGQLVHNTGTFTRNGTGPWIVNVPFESGGTVDIATATINAASYTQSASGTLHLHISGATPGTQFSQLIVEAAAALAGKLQVTTAPTFHPKSGASFQIITGNPRSGTFSSVEETGGGLGEGLAYKAEYEATGVKLVVGSAPSAPTVTKLKPTSGPPAGGTSVTISGTNLVGATKVEFGTTEATFVEKIEKGVTVLVAVAPAHAVAKVHVIVTSPGGTSKPSTKDYFKYTPIITKVTPNTGSKTGGTTVTVTGVGFALGKTATVFKFGTANGTSVNCLSTTECTVVSPAHAVGKVDVKATVNKVSSPKTTADQFTYS
jgi:hypothetical protein